MVTSAGTQLVIRTLHRDDIAAVSAIHMKAFPHRAMSALGEDVLVRYYTWLMDDTHREAQCIGAFADSTLVGFCFGGRYNGAMTGFLQRNRNFLIAKVISRPWLLVTNELFYSRIGMALRILKPATNANRRTLSSEESAARAAYLRGFGILAIAVDPTTQGRGVGKLLMASAEAEARRRHIDYMNLSVDMDNAQAIRFYEHLGWVKVMSDSSWSGEMRKSLKPSP